MEIQSIKNLGTIRTDAEIDELQKAIDNLALLEPIRLYLDSPIGKFIDQLDIRPNATLSALRRCVTQITSIVNPILVIKMHSGLYKLEHDPNATLADIGITAGMDIIVHSHKTIGEFGDAILPLDTVMFDLFEEENDRAIAEAVAQNIEPALKPNNNNIVYSNVSEFIKKSKGTYREHLERGQEKFSFVIGESTNKTLLRYQKWVNKIYETCEIPWVCKLNDLPFGVPGDWKIPPPNIYKVIYPNESVLAAYNDVVGRPMILPPIDVENVHNIYELVSLN